MGLLERLRTNRLDAGLAAAFLLLGLVQIEVAPIAPRGVGEVYLVGSTLPLAWRRTFPVEAALASSAFWLIPLDGYAVLGYVVVILQFYALGNRGEPDRVVAVVAVVASVVSVVGTLLGPEQAVAAVGGLIAVLAPTVAGRLVRRQQELNRALVDLTDQLAAERVRAEETAVEAERARIAQELHDVVGHEVTLMAIQAEAAASALRSDPARAVEPVEAIRAIAHETLTEMRAVLGVLAPHGEDEQPTSVDLEALADRARAAGIPNDLCLTGVPQPDHAPASLAVGRIVQECLTNAGRHAPGRPVSVSVVWAPDEVQVRAVNSTDGDRAVSPGRGLTGMRHRAALLGGTFRAVAEGGRFDVRVSIPVGERS